MQVEQLRALGSTHRWWYCGSCGREETGSSGDEKHAEHSGILVLPKRSACYSLNENEKSCYSIELQRWTQFCCKMWTDSLLWNQYGNRIDAEGKF